jgi:hypothetical protein
MTALRPFAGTLLPMQPSQFISKTFTIGKKLKRAGALLRLCVSARLIYSICMKSCYIFWLSRSPIGLQTARPGTSCYHGKPAAAPAHCHFVERENP